MEGKAQNPARDMDQMTDDLQSLVVSHGQQEEPASSLLQPPSKVSGFFGLPLELRDIIYDFALRSADEISIDGNHLGRDLPKMLFLSKQVYREARPIFHRINDFSIKFRLERRMPFVASWLQSRIADAGNMRTFQQLTFNLDIYSDWHYLPYLAPILDMLRRGVLRVEGAVKFKFIRPYDHMPQVFEEARSMAIQATSTAGLLDVYEHHCVTRAQISASGLRYERSMDTRRIGMKEEMDKVRLIMGVSVPTSQEDHPSRIRRLIKCTRFKLSNEIRSLKFLKELRGRQALKADIVLRYRHAEKIAETAIPKVSPISVMIRDIKDRNYWTR